MLLTMPDEKRDQLEDLAKKDVGTLISKYQGYGDSWKKRGGTGAFFNFARKIDRIENIAAKYGYDIFKAILTEDDEHNIIDDIRDLRCYLLLVEAEIENLKLNKGV